MNGADKVALIRSMSLVLCFAIGLNGRTILSVKAPGCNNLGKAR